MPSATVVCETHVDAEASPTQEGKRKMPDEETAPDAEAEETAPDAEADGGEQDQEEEEEEDSTLEPPPKKAKTSEGQDEDEVAAEGAPKKDKAKGKAKKPKQTAAEVAEEVAAGDAQIRAYLATQKSYQGREFLFAVISKGRPGNVPIMHAHFAGTGVLPVWIVGRGESEAYTAAGASRVVEGGGLCASRNAAIDLAAKEGKIACEMSDDLAKIAILHQEVEGWQKPPCMNDANAAARACTQWRCSPVGAAMYLDNLMQSVPHKKGEKGAFLGGAFPNVNHGLAFGQGPLSKELFIVGDFLVIDPASPLRFDEEITLKEDYDLTAQHLNKHGRVLRSNRLFVTAKHYTNEGGAVADRNDEREQYNIGVLKYKWPGVFKQHPTRGENEVKMDWTQRSLEYGGKKSASRGKKPAGYNAAPPKSAANRGQASMMSFFGKK